jgi:hypothetical protein
MKTTKRILCIALTLLLGLAVLAPAALAADDPNAPVITAQPKSKIYIFAGKSLTVTVAASLPAGSDGTLSYAWYDYDWQPGYLNPPVATGASATIAIPAATQDEFNKEYPGANRTLYAVVTNTYVDGEEVKTATAKSNPVNVTAINPMGTALSLTWNNLQEGRDPWSFFGLFGINTYGLGQLGWSSLLTFPTWLIGFLPSYLVGWILTLIYKP